MAAPSTPAVNGVKSIYVPSDTITLTWIVPDSVTSGNVKIYRQQGYGQMVLVVDDAATRTSTSGGISKFEWTSTVSSFATAGEKYTYSVTATSSGGTSSPATGMFGVYSVPTVTLSVDGGSTVSGLPLAIQWAVTDPTGVSRQRLYITEANDPTKYIYGAGGWAGNVSANARSLALYIADVPTIEDGKAYTISLEVTNGVGLYSKATYNFTTSWTMTGDPEIVSVVPTDSMAVEVTVHTIAQTTATVWRVLNGERELVATGQDIFSFIDPLPPFNVDYTYEAIAVNDQTGVASNMVSASGRVNTSVWALNFGEHAEEFVLLRFNPNASYSIEHGGEMYHFADGGAGGGYPVWYGTTDRDESGSFSWQTANRSLADKLHDLSLKYPYGWIRDPYGHSWYAYIRPSMSHDRTRVCKVSIDWEKMRWREP